MDSNLLFVLSCVVQVIDKIDVPAPSDLLHVIASSVPPPLSLLISAGAGESTTMSSNTFGQWIALASANGGAIPTQVSVQAEPELCLAQPRLVFSLNQPLPKSKELCQTVAFCRISNSVTLHTKDMCHFSLTTK